MMNLSKQLSALRAITMAMLLVVLNAPFAQAEEYLLGVQDRLRIHVAEWPTLSGEFVVGAAGEIALPVVGRAGAEGLTTTELGRQIAIRLQDAAGLRDLPDALVEVVNYRPFYITGNVTSPGEYSYRPGMIVLNAVSIAGGMYRADQRSAWDIERVAISSLGEASVLDLRLRDLMAQQIRLNAQIDGAEVLPMPEAQADADLARALQEQTRIFEDYLQRRETSQFNLTASIESLEKELDAINASLSDSAMRRQSAEAELAQVRELVKQNLAVQRLAPLETSLAQIMRDQQDLEISRLRAEQRILETRNQLSQDDEMRRADATNELQRVNAQLREVEEQRLALSKLLSGASHYSGEVALSLEEDEAEPQYVIVHVNGDDVTETVASEQTRVMPGDIVKVIRRTSGSPAPRLAN
jgi:exopolysaccharide production protein ExoF